MDGEAELIDPARTGAVGAHDELSVVRLPYAAAIPGRQRLQKLRPAHLRPPVVPRPPAERVQDSAVCSLTGVSGERMDEREADLIRRVLLGDAGAYDGILAPHLPMAWRLAYSQLHDHSRADDCVQEAAKRGWLRLENLKPGMPFRPWFIGIVVRQCKEDQRQEDRRTRLQALMRRVGPGHWLRSSDDDWLEHSLQGTELRRAFASLPRGQQIAIYLHFVEDLPQEEVAETLGISVSNVKSRIHRAKQRLRQALADKRG
jgi:RNA polymerase sigma-70 factor, ECF subfamily